MIVYIILTIIHGINSNLLSKINNKNIASGQQSFVISFLNNVEGFESKSVCKSLLKSSVQAKINNFKSIISTCPEENFCRIAMEKDGLAYGAQNSQLQSMNLIS